MQLLRKRLTNGMMVIMEPRELPVVALSISNRFGGGFESSQVKGIAHFIEHLVFTGTKTRTHEDISREIEKRGGILNAFTSQEVTSFWFKLPSEHVFVGLDILSDILNNPSFGLEKFEKEKKVILEEIKMYHDDPQRGVYDNILANLYEKPFGDLITGSAKTVNGLERDFVYDYFQKMYASEHLLVTLVGNADFEKICSYLEEHFPVKKRVLEVLNPRKKHGESVEERPGIDQSHFIFGVHAPLMNDKNYYALEVLDAYLANGMSSRLFLKIREDRGLAYTIQSSLSTEQSHSYYTIYVGTTKEALPEVKKIILDELILSDLKEKDLMEAKERLIGLRKISSEESARVMTELLFAELIGKAEDYYAHEQKIRAVTLKQVKTLAQQLSKEYSTAAIVPR